MAAGIDHNIGGLVEAHDTLIFETVQVDRHLFLVFVISKNRFQNPSIYSDFYFLHHLADFQFRQIGPLFLEGVVKVCYNDFFVRVFRSEFIFL